MARNNTLGVTGQPAVSVNDILAKALSLGEEMTRAAIEAFAANLIVERDADDLNRLNVHCMPVMRRADS